MEDEMELDRMKLAERKGWPCDAMLERPARTVGDLRDHLAGLPDDMELSRQVATVVGVSWHVATVEEGMTKGFRYPKVDGAELMVTTRTWLDVASEKLDHAVWQAGTCYESELTYWEEEVQYWTEEVERLSSN